VICLENLQVVFIAVSNLFSEAGRAKMKSI
jgi:hypothetical protein